MQVFFFICIDKSTDITSSAWSAIFFRFRKGDELCEEMVALLTLPERTTGVPRMTGEKIGFVSLFTKEVGHAVIGFYCIIHEKALYAKAGLKEFQEVMQTVTKVVNCISA